MARLKQGLQDGKEYDLKDGDSIVYEPNTQCIAFLARQGGELFFLRGNDNKHLIGPLDKNQFKKIAGLIADLHGGHAIPNGTQNTNADDWIFVFKLRT